MRAKGDMKREGCEGWDGVSGTVARVTLRVATPYVNPSIWSILQSKRIGFSWRWISSTEKLSLSLCPSVSTFLHLHLPPPAVQYVLLRLFFFAIFLFVSQCFFIFLDTWSFFPPFSLLASFLPPSSKPYCKCVCGATSSGSTWSLVIFSKCQFVSPNSHIKDYTVCCVCFSLSSLSAFVSVCGFSVRGDGMAVMERT